MREKKRGLSLVETCVAITIVMIILGSLVMIFSQGYRFLRKARMEVYACFLAQEKMEELSTAGDAALFSNPDSHDESKAAMASPFAQFQREVNVICPYLGYNDLAHIIVTVYWQGQKAEKSLRYETLKANF